MLRKNMANVFLIRICNYFVLRWRGACTFPQPRRRSNQRRSFCMSKVMDDTAFFAQEAAQGAATSRLGVPRPRGRPRKKSCKRESGNDQDLWCAGCRNNRVCRLVDNNVLAAPILYGSSSKHPPAQPLSSTEEDPGRALGVEVAEYTCTGVIAARWAAVSLGRVQILAAVHGVRVPDEARVWVSVCLSHARGVPSPVLG